MGVFQSESLLKNKALVPKEKIMNCGRTRSLPDNTTVFPMVENLPAKVSGAYESYMTRIFNLGWLT